MRASLLEVVSDTVVLKKAGLVYRGLCPFHGEKTASFNVNPEKGFFKCFGCGEAGDVFAFVQKIKGIDFISAVVELAHRYGVKLAESAEDRKEYDKRSQFLLLYEQTALYYKKLLEDPKEGGIGRKYLADRGITDDTISRFRLGYAPSAWDGLLSYLSQDSKVSPQLLAEAGLVRQRQESQGFYDLFRNRLMVPICDSEGRVIAFGGRTLGDDQVKYLNSPETAIYHKGLHLFAFNNAREAIKQKDAVIVVEGYFDAISCHQHGFTNTVATLGTALTEQQAKLLVRYTDRKRVYLSFDADPAGIKAVDRGIETITAIAQGIGIELRVINIPGGKDPDECLRSNGGEQAFAEAVEKASLMIEYQLERAINGLDITSHMGRIDGAKKIVPVLALLKNAVERGEYIRQWAMRLHLREEEILSDVSQFRKVSGLAGGARSFQPQGYAQGYGPGFKPAFNQQYKKPYTSPQPQSAKAITLDGARQAPDFDNVDRRDLDDSGWGQQEEGEGSPVPLNKKSQPLSAQEAQALGISPGYTHQAQPSFSPKGQGGFNKSSGNASGNKFKKGNNQKKEIADEEGLPMPQTMEAMKSLNRQPVAGLIEAERAILALCLTSREDFDIVNRQMQEEKLTSEFHQKIKEAIDGIAGQFNNIEDLQFKIQDRLSLEPAASRALVDVVFKAEEFRKQKPVTQIVLNHSRARILKERIDRLTTGLRQRLNEEGSDVVAVQSKIMQLIQITKKDLLEAATRDDLDNLSMKIGGIEATYA
jgi:DNA primase catalytic core